MRSFTELTALTIPTDSAYLLTEAWSKGIGLEGIEKIKTEQSPGIEESRDFVYRGILTTADRIKNICRNGMDRKDTVFGRNRISVAQLPRIAIFLSLAWLYIPDELRDRSLYSVIFVLRRDKIRNLKHEWLPGRTVETDDLYTEEHIDSEAVCKIWLFNKVTRQYELLWKDGK